MTQENYVGIDLSKEELTVAYYPCQETYSVLYRPKEVSSLVEKLKALCPERVVMEASGGLERELCIALWEAGLPVCVVNPRQVRDFARAKGTLCKTDRVDARMIANFAEAIKPEVTAIPDGMARELSCLVSRRRQLVLMASQEKTRLHQAYDEFVRRDIEAHLEELGKKVTQINERIGELIEQSPDWKEKEGVLVSVPGVGKVTSRTLLSEVPELGKVSHKQIAKLVGLAPHSNESGKFKGKRHIFGGRSHVRKPLYMATLVAIKYNPQVSAFYQRLVNRGKEKKVALVACMRKLLIILNAMLRHKSAFRAIG